MFYTPTARIPFTLEPVGSPRPTVSKRHLLLSKHFILTVIDAGILSVSVSSDNLNQPFSSLMLALSLWHLQKHVLGTLFLWISGEQSGLMLIAFPLQPI